MQELVLSCHVGGRDTTKVDQAWQLPLTTRSQNCLFSSVACAFGIAAIKLLSMARDVA